MALSRGFPRVGFPTTLPCGVRTFLEGPVVSPTSPRLLGRQHASLGAAAAAPGRPRRATTERGATACGARSAREQRRSAARRGAACPPSTAQRRAGRPGSRASPSAEALASVARAAARRSAARARGAVAPAASRRRGEQRRPGPSSSARAHDTLLQTPTTRPSTCDVAVRIGSSAAFSGCRRTWSFSRKKRLTVASALPHQRDDDLAVGGGLLAADDHVVAVEDAGVLHRVAPHAQHVLAVLAAGDRRAPARTPRCSPRRAPAARRRPGRRAAGPPA